MQLDRTTVGEIVATDFRAAGVLERFGIDFCCGGRRTLADACRTAAADPEVVMRELQSLPTGSADEDVTQWPLDRVVAFIVSKHHAYVRGALPTIARHLAKIEAVHGSRHPELSRVSGYFEQVTADLHQHMMKEEQVLFPYIVELAASAATGERVGGSPFGTVENPIRMMEREHQDAADELRVIRELTNGYAAPADGCATYATCMSELQEFERDLHRHVHLENNVLFPRAIELEALTVR